jgi:uridylate kinase
MNKYKRILLKLSGEALAKDGNTVDPNTLSQVVDIIKSVLKQKVEVGIVVGGGNIFRGAENHHFPHAECLLGFIVINRITNTTTNWKTRHD